MASEVMRRQVMYVYGPKAFNWITKVKRMSDNQILAIYLRMKESGKFG